MLSDENIRQIRQDEILFLARYFRPESEILEVGAGTGFQALELSRMGFRVKAIDLPNSTYSNQRVFDVVDYDGTHIPFPDHSFDIVFSSNVLEHVVDISGMLRETRRVLRANGYAVHAMPTPLWRVWSAIAGYADIVPFLRHSVKTRTGAVKVVRGLAARMIPHRPHGERGNTVTELWHFRAATWRAVFRQNGFDVIEDTEMGLLYSQWKALGTRLSIAARRRAARILGSSSRVYVVKPSVSGMPRS